MAAVFGLSPFVVASLSWLFLPLFFCQDKRGGDRSPFSGNSGDSWNIRPANLYKKVRGVVMDEQSGDDDQDTDHRKMGG